MMKFKKWAGIALAGFCMALVPMTAYAGWEQAGNTYRYRNEDGTYVISQWIDEDGDFYYMDEKGTMAVSTTVPDGYLVGADGKWVKELQQIGTYVRTPYDNLPYYYDPDWKRYIFDETTDYAWVSDHLVLAAVRGIIPASELSETNRAVYEEVCRFLIGLDYNSSDYEKAKRVYEEITGRAAYHEGNYVQEDDEVYSILINGMGKCVGFARTYKLLANAAGLKCGFREDGAHMWNVVYVDGTPMTIDASTTGTSADFYLGRERTLCPNCGYGNIFGNRVTEQPCKNCGTQIQNPKYN